MRSVYSIPLLGAALVTLGALAYRFSRGGGQVTPATPSSSAPEDAVSLLDRLRERGF